MTADILIPLFIALPLGVALLIQVVARRRPGLAQPARAAPGPAWRRASRLFRAP